MELEICPFCGGIAKIYNNGIWEPVMDFDGAYVDIHTEEADTYWAECEDCHCMTMGCNTEREVADIWNMRII